MIGRPALREGSRYHLQLIRILLDRYFPFREQEIFSRDFTVRRKCAILFTLSELTRENLSSLLCIFFGSYHEHIKIHESGADQA